MSTSEMPGTVPVFYMLLFYPHKTPVRGYCPHFTDEETEVQRDGAKELSGRSQDSKPHLSDIKAHVLSYFRAEDFR